MAIAKSGAARAARPGGRVGNAQLPNAVEGRIAEICRELAVQAKRLRQLQDEADELHAVLQAWARQLETTAAP